MTKSKSEPERLRIPSREYWLDLKASDSSWVIAYDPWEDVVYIRIPPARAKPLVSGCSCSFCTAHPNIPPTLDALAIPYGRAKSPRIMRTVHMPDPKAFEAQLKPMKPPKLLISSTCPKCAKCSKCAKCKRCLTCGR